MLYTISIEPGTQIVFFKAVNGMEKVNLANYFSSDFPLYRWFLLLFFSSCSIETIKLAYPIVTQSGTF